MKPWEIRPGFMRWVLKPFFLLVVLAGTNLYTEISTTARVEHEFRARFENYLMDNPQCLKLRPMPMRPATAGHQDAQAKKVS